MFKMSDGEKKHCAQRSLTSRQQLYCYSQLSADCFGFSVHMVESPKNKTVGSHFQQTASHKLTVRYLLSVKWRKSEVNKWLVRSVTRFANQKRDGWFLRSRWTSIQQVNV